eukprot:2612027-Prymnesium_polylepis.1
MATAVVEGLLDGPRAPCVCPPRERRRAVQPVLADAHRRPRQARGGSRGARGTHGTARRSRGLAPSRMQCPGAA